MAFDWLGLAQTGLGLVNAGNAMSGASEASNAAATISATSSAQAQQLSAAQQAQAMSLFTNLLGMQLKQQAPWETAGQRALMDYEYLTTGRKPDTSKYSTPEYQATKAEAARVRSELETLRSSKATPETTYVPTTQSRVGGGRLTKKVHTTVVNTPVTESQETADKRQQGKIADLEMKLLGLGGTAADDGMESYARNWQAPVLEESPLYKYQADIGSQKINRQLKARSLYGSGKAISQLSDFYTGLGAQESAQVENRYLNLMKAGQGASAATGAAGTQMFGTVANAGSNNASIGANAILNTAQTLGTTAISMSGVANSYSKTVESSLQSLLDSLGGKNKAPAYGSYPTQQSYSTGAKMLGIG